MKEPATPEEVLELHKILRSDPQRYLQIVNDWIRENPENSHAYYSRHLGLERIGEPRRALEDLNKAIELAPSSSAIFIGSSWRRLSASRRIRKGA